MRFFAQKSKKTDVLMAAPKSIERKPVSNEEMAGRNYEAMQRTALARDRRSINQL